MQTANHTGLLDSIPIIFIHYGYCNYLDYTLKVAKKYNPDKRIILLGDAQNKHLEKFGVEHYCFSAYLQSPEISRFNKIFHIVGREDFKITGKDNANSEKDDGSFWVQFVFLRYFILDNFLEKKQFDRCWTFDSDTLIVSRLSTLEAPFSNYDNTELQFGSIMQGLINNRGVLWSYINCINELFADAAFLKNARDWLRTQSANYAFTEMWAYSEFKNRYTFSHVNLDAVDRKLVFDNAVAFSNGFELKSKRGFIPIKRVFVDSEGNFYFKWIETGELIKTATINCSWVSIHIYDCIAAAAKKDHNRDEPRELAFTERLKFRKARHLLRITKKLHQLALKYTSNKKTN